MPRPSIHASGIKYSCDRQLLSSAHRNFQVAAILAVLKVVLLLGSPTNANPDGSNAQEESMDFEIGATDDPAKLETMGLQDFAKYTLQQLCR